MAKSCPSKSRALDKVNNGGRRQRRRVKTKKQICIDLLSRPKGSSVPELTKATGWQVHSVRGVLSRIRRSEPGIALTSNKPSGGVRRYRMVQSEDQA